MAGGPSIVKEIRPTGTPTFELWEIAHEFIADYAHSSPRTQEFYRDLVDGVFVRCMKAQEITRADAVTPTAIRDYLKTEADRGLAPQSVVHRYNTARTFLQWCVEQGYADENPVLKVRRPKLNEPTREGFARDEILRLVHYAGAGPGITPIRDRAIVIFLLDTGARASELLGLTFSDIDRQNRRVTLHGKGSKDRRVPVGAPAWKALMHWMRVRWDVPGDKVWVTQQRTEMNYAALNAMVHNLGGRAGVRDCSPHRFRHTAATEHFRQHGNIAVVRSMLGHVKLDTTQRYLKRIGLDYAAEAGLASPSEWLVT